MNSGNPLVETWIPDGGFKIERRKIKTPDGSTLAECLVPKWTSDDLTPDHPCARRPCLHRVLADCPPTPEGILHLADRYGLLAFTIPRKPAPSEKVRADVLPPEPLDIWRAEICALRACVDSGQSSPRIDPGAVCADAAEASAAAATRHLERFVIAVADAALDVSGDRIGVGWVFSSV